VKFALPDRLPKGVEDLDRLWKQAGLEIEVFKARRAARETFSESDVARLEYLLAGRDKIDAVNSSRLAVHGSGHAVASVLVDGMVDAVEVYPPGVTDRGRER